MTTISTAGSRYWFKRKLSRTRRLIRLRATAFLILRLEIANPRRAQPLSLGRINTVKNPSAETVGWLKT